MSKEYWSCLIGPADLNEYEDGGADFPLRMAVRDEFNYIFGPDEVCCSGWGISEERYELLRKISLKSDDQLRKFLNE